jgi:hypothetical protein
MHPVMGASSAGEPPSSFGILGGLLYRVGDVTFTVM